MPHESESRIDSVLRELEEQAAAAPDEQARRRILDTADTVRRGRRYARGAGGVLTTASKAVHGAGRVLDKALYPFTAAGGGVLSGVGAVGNDIIRSPRALRSLGVAALTAPVALSTASRTYNTVTDGILRARQDPRRLVEERDVMASLDSFLEKKAAFAGSPTDLMRDNAIKGLFGGVGSEVAKSLVSGLGGLASSAGAALFGNPQKRTLLDRLLTTDQILADALKRNPATREQIMEAYTTLNRFAPTLATDVNAVRSFLREVVLGGGHVNYATIKNLIETEKSINSGYGR